MKKKIVIDATDDAEVKKALPKVLFITPHNARKEAIQLADYVTESDGGHGAFLDLALHVVKYFC